MMMVKRRYSNNERLHLINRVEQVQKEKNIPADLACIEVGVPASTYYGWKKRMRKSATRPPIQTTPFAPFMFTSVYNPTVEVILVGAR